MRILVVGSGIAGIEAALTAAKLGSDVCIIDKQDFGGNYLNKTCIPSKLFLNFLKVKDLMKAKKLVKDKILHYKKGTLELFDRNDIKYYNAKFFAEKFRYKIKPNIDLDNFDKVILCNGSIPITPNIEGKEFLSFSTNLLDLNEEDEKVCIIGAGPEGIELAEIFSSIGSEVCLVDKRDRILAIEDEDISYFYEKILKEKGIKLFLSRTVLGVKIFDNHYKVILEKDSEIVANKVISCVGWVSNYEGIEPLLENGKLMVNNKLQINDRYFAAGDVVKVFSANVSKVQGRIAARNALGHNEEFLDERLIPHTIFSNPRISTIGLKEKDFLDKNKIRKIKIKNLSLKDVYSLKHFYLKILIEKDKVVGVSCISEKADEIINFFSLVIRNNISINELSSYIPSKPSVFEEIIDKINSFS